MVMENSNYGRLLRIMVIGNYGVVIIVMANLWLSFFFLIMVMGNFTITITINSPGTHNYSHWNVWKNWGIEKISFIHKNRKNKATNEIFKNPVLEYRPAYGAAYGAAPHHACSMAWRGQASFPQKLEVPNTTPKKVNIEFLLLW